MRSVSAVGPTFTVPPVIDNVPPLRDKLTLVFRVPPVATVRVPLELIVTLLRLPDAGAVAASVG